MPVLALSRSRLCSTTRAAIEAPGRPRKHKTDKDANHAYYMRHRDRILKMEAIRRRNKKAQDTHVLSLEEAKAIHATARPPDTGARVLSLKEVLVDAAGGNVDREADVLTIRALLAQGCDFEADILPTVARDVPQLPRPLKNWGAQWLVQEILTARDRRLFPTLALRRPLADEDHSDEEHPLKSHPRCPSSNA
jgi:hypothetical protein